MKRKYTKTLLVGITVISVWLPIGEFEAQVTSKAGKGNLETLVVNSEVGSWDAQRDKVVGSVAASYLASARGLGPEYVDASIPVVRLLTREYPSLSKKVGERGISIGSVVRVLNSDKENRAVINKVLREAESLGCQ